MEGIGGLREEPVRPNSLLQFHTYPRDSPLPPRDFRKLFK